MKLSKAKGILMRLNLIVALLLTCAIGTYATNTFAQRVTLSKKDAKLKDVFSDIRKQTSYSFIYTQELLEKSNPINIEVLNMPLAEVLDLCLKNQPLTYKLSGKSIILKEKALPIATKANASANQQETFPLRGTVYIRTDDGTATVAGASVRSNAQAVGTGADGVFNLSVKRGDNIVISMMGYITKTVVVGTARTIDVILEPAINEVEDVVITGYMTQEKRSITGAMSSIKSDVLENVPVQSIDRAMQGQLSGVNVMAANGVPGGPVNINIRGMGSITAGNEPLIIVDGVQLNMSTSSGQTASNPLAFLNNNDVESIEVLKDGAAASIYGAQAANGVVLITTKRGKAGKTKIGLNYYNGITTPMPEVAMMSTEQYFTSRFEARNNRYPTRTLERNRADMLTAVGLPADLTDEDIAALGTYNWQEAAFRTGRTNNADISASGGNEKTQFFVSASYNKTDGNVVAIDFERATAKINLRHEISKRLSFDLNTNLSSIVQNGTSGSNGSTGAYAAPQYAAPTMLPFIPIYNPDGSMNAPIEGFPGSANRNPIQESLLGTLQSRTKSLVSNVSATYKILDNLSFKSFYGLDFRLIDDERYVDPRTRSGFAAQGSLTVGARQNRNFITNQTLQYNTSWNDQHNLSALLGFEYRNDNREMNSISASGFTTHQFRTLQSAAVIGSASGSWTGFKRAGVFTQVNYDFNKKYLLSGVLRYDGSSRFGANNYFGWFPAISAGWNISEESFMDDQPWINQLKIRAGYGETGNDAIGNFDARALYGSSSSSNYNQEPGLRPSGLANTELKWERNLTSNIGLDYGFFNNRISGSVEVFRRVSSDLLLDRPLPYLSGFSNVTSNIGRVKNEGVEFDIRTTNVKAGHFTWTTNFNITFLRNRVLQLLGDDQVLPGDQSVRVGYSLRTNVMLEYAGVNSATGRPMWYDANGEVTYTPSSPNDLKIFGNQMSDFFGGFTNTFSYKGFSASAFFHYDYGRELSNAGMHSRWFLNGGDNRNTLERIFLNRWTTPGQVTTVPRPFDANTEVGSISHATTSSRFLEDASFIRLKNVTLSYQLPTGIAKRLGMTNLKVYAQGENLATFTKWTGYDPELMIGFGEFSSTQGTIPQTKVYTFGVQVGF
ncbi:TonB-dependent receptor [Sphingobacterium corticibacter]|uniref:SusC/RagA family TonB-linked outer membrane protein n=1 Tax=Sphingobacterium corticibacter TaxID=2171749 RepID=A0A2T8HEJ7_9SPHI|nr:TonB-dependent receptor [Sphingobacterium corticibacter]PVH23866.1 SusC/RagA family TonB-linked outer membrane protein [Sphingobacterium corticibacter]